jgi:FtsZ-binding cell division protein ZapB
MELSKRIDNILGPWPTPDQVREALLLLARHLQRHDELVTLQRDIDAYGEDRQMPDDALDALEAQRDALRRRIEELKDELRGERERAEAQNQSGKGAS